MKCYNRSSVILDTRVTAQNKTRDNKLLVIQECSYEELDRLGFALPFGKSAGVRRTDDSSYSCLQFANAYRANTLAIFRQRAGLQSVAIAARCENPIGARGATRSKNFENISNGATICERRAKKKHTHIHQWPIASEFIREQSILSRSNTNNR